MSHPAVGAPRPPRNGPHRTLRAADLRGLGQQLLGDPGLGPLGAQPNPIRTLNVAEPGLRRPPPRWVTDRRPETIGSLGPVRRDHSR